MGLNDPVAPIDAAVLASMQTLRDAVLDGLDAANTARPKRIVTVVPGTQVVWDKCCDGLLGLRLAGMRPRMGDTPRADLRQPCAILYWDADIEITLLRCAATVSDTGVAPTADRLASEGTANLTDMGAIIQAIKANHLAYSISPVSPQGPQGGCGGWAVTATLRINDTPC